MRIIKPTRVKQFAKDYDEAASDLMNWLRIAQNAEWANFSEVRKNFKSADAIKVRSGRTVVCFNIRFNRYRLIVAIKYNWSVVYILRFMTHAEYDRDQWKQEL